MSTALVIIDVQNDYFPGGKMEVYRSSEVGENIHNLIAYFREKNEAIIHMQHISIQSNASFFIKKTEGVKINSCALPLETEKVIIKFFPNSFRRTGLNEILQQMNVDRLVIAGMMTHMCVDATTRAAFDLGYKCIVIEDCCATRDLQYKNQIVSAEDVQSVYLASMDGTFAKVMTVDTYISENLTNSST